MYQQSVASGGAPAVRAPMAVHLPEPPCCPAATLIELNHVSKTFAAGSYRKTPALEQVSLAIPPRSTNLVLGPSGSGKTTLLSLIGCMTRPSAGRIRVAGREVSCLPEDVLAQLRRSLFGFVFQQNNLVPWASALDNVMLPALPDASVNGELPERAAELLGRVGLSGLEHVRVGRLSGGEQQRVAIARALINRPSVLVADEPTAHLDTRATMGFLELVEELHEVAGMTVVVASHDPALHTWNRPAPFRAASSTGWTTVVELRHGRMT